MATIFNKCTLIILQFFVTNVILQRIGSGYPEVNPPQDRQFRVVYEWRTFDFAYRNEADRQGALFRGEFIPNNVIISEIQPYANRLYLSMPRMLPGVPATLGWIVTPDNNGRTDPEIEPYPSWAMNQVGNCSALQFVQGITIDSLGILWAVDSGRIETLLPGNTQVICSPKLMLFDLKRNGSLLLRYDFPQDVVAYGTNYLNKIVVDDSNGGFAYITDNNGADPGIVVYSRRLNRSWKVRENNSMRAARNAVNFAVNGTALNFSIHIDGIALGPYYNPQNSLQIHEEIISSPIFTRNSETQIPQLSNEEDKDFSLTGDVNLNNNGVYSPDQNYERRVFYSPLSSYHLYSLPASMLRDPEIARRITPREMLEAVTDHGLKISQVDGMTMDNQGILYYGLLRNHAIARWDSYRPFSYDNQQIIAKDDTHIQWTDGMGIDETGYLYVVVNRLYNFVAGRLDPNFVNFRVLRAKVGSLSYVHTGHQNLYEQDLLNIHGGGPIYDIGSNTLGPSISNPTISSTLYGGISGGISSTTPISLGSISSYGSYNSASTLNFSKLIFGFVVIFTTTFRTTIF